MNRRACCRLVAGAFALVAAIATPAAPARGEEGAFTLDEKGVYRHGDFSMEVDEKGGIAFYDGSRRSELGTWHCHFLPEGPGKYQASNGDFLKDRRRVVDAAAGTVLIEGKFNTPAGQEITYRQKMEAVGGGVRVSVAFTLPSGSDAINVMINRRIPFGWLHLKGEDYGEASWAATTEGGAVVRGDIEPNYAGIGDLISPAGQTLRGLTIWNPRVEAGITVEPGPKSVVELLDFRKPGAHFRLNVNSSVAKANFSETFRPANRQVLPPCTIKEVGGEARPLYAPADHPLELRLRLVNHRDEEVKGRLEWTLESARDRAAEKGSLPVKLAARGNETVTVALLPKTRDLYRFSARLVSGDATLATFRLPIASVVSLPPTGSLPAGSPFGIHERSPGLLDVATQVGVKWVRYFSQSWADFEPEKGQFNWKETDEFFEWAKRHQVSVIYTVWGVPLWASSAGNLSLEDFLKRFESDPEGYKLMLLASGGLPAIQSQWSRKFIQKKAAPADWQDYRRFLAALLERYGPLIAAVEVSNEVDGQNHFFGPPKEYARFVKETHEGVKAYSPKMLVVGLAASGCRPHPYTLAVFDAGAAASMDVYAWHSYYEPFESDAHVRAQKEALAKRGISLPMWITELGMPVPPKVDDFPMGEAELDAAVQKTAAGNPPNRFFSAGEIFRSGGKVRFAPNGAVLVSEAEQARALVCQYILQLSEGVSRFTIHGPYSFVHERAPVLMGVAHAMMASRLSDATWAGKVESPVAGFVGQRFRTPRGDVAVIWKRGERQTLFVRPGDKVRVFDLMGNPIPARPEKGTLAISLGEDPVYLEAGKGGLEGCRVEGALERVAVEFPRFVLAGRPTAAKVRLKGPSLGEGQATLVFEPPQGWGIRPARVEAALKAGEEAEREVMIEAPADATEGSRTIGIRITARAGDLVATHTEAQAVSVVRPVACPSVPGDFKMDGDLGEWRGRKPMVMDSAARIAWRTRELAAEQQTLWSGPADLSAKIWVAWDARGLVVAMEVKDDVVKRFPDKGREFLGDCLEFFLAGDPRKEPGSYGSGDRQFLLAPPVSSDDKGVLSGAVPPGTTFAARRTADGYAIEMVIPWSPEAFPGFRAALGSIFGFDVAVDDWDHSTSERKLQMVLFGNEWNHRDTSGFGRFLLEAQPSPADANR